MAVQGILLASPCVRSRVCPLAWLTVKHATRAQDFRRIAMYLDGRTTGDCVQHYYRMQKLDEFAAVRRKQQLKKRRTAVRGQPLGITYLGIAALPGAKRAADMAMPGLCCFGVWGVRVSD